MIGSTAAVGFAVLIGAVIMFQLALAAGMPWGEYAMGGKFPGKYPPAMRWGIFPQIAILALLALLVLSRSGVLLPEWHSFSRSAIWFVVAYSALATFMNLITRSKRERSVWAPVSALLLATSAIVALE
ncbi:hypothetical protein MO973_22820 [Paenibacillus sp. TRM 82003]|nr:hypothetical protein [Paenibacillus sp. TRM 82003]